MTADYTFVRACDVFGSGDTVVSEIRDTGRGVEVTTRPKYYSSEKVIICRRSDVSKYPPPRKPRPIVCKRAKEKPPGGFA